MTEVRIATDNVNSIEDCQAFAAGLNENGDDDEFLYINAIEKEE